MRKYLVAFWIFLTVLVFPGMADATVAPTPAAATLASNAVTITLLMQDSAVAGLLPSTGLTGFTVTVNGTTATLSSETASSTTNNVTLVLASAAASGATVTISYAPGNCTDNQATPQALATFSNLAVTDERVAFTSKYNTVPGGATSTGAAGNTTAVPGWTDVTGSTWSQSSVGGNYVIASVNNNNTLQQIFSTTITANDQQVVITVPAANNTNTYHIRLHHSNPYYVTSSNPGPDYYDDVYIGLAGKIQLYPCTYAGGSGTVIASPTFTGSVNSTDTYQWTVTISGAGSSASFTASLYDVTTASAVLWNAGSATWSTTFSSNAGVGTLQLLASSGQYAGINYYSRAALTALSIPAPSVLTQTSNTISLSATATGGAPPYTYTWYSCPYSATPATGLYPTGNQLLNGTGGVTLSGSNNSTMTQVGLVQDVMQNYKVLVTDSASSTASAPLILPTLKYAPTVEHLSFFGVGDSITVGGAPGWTQECANEVCYLTGRTAASIPYATDALSGTTSAAFVTPTALATLAGLINTAGATDVFTRIGINDTLTADSTVSNIGIIANYVLANCPTVQTVWIVPLTYRPLQNGSTAFYHNKSRYYQLLIPTLDNGATIQAMPPIDYDAFMGNPSYSTDGTHPTQYGYTLLGDICAAEWVVKTYLATTRTTVGQPTNRSLRRTR